MGERRIVVRRAALRVKHRLAGVEEAEAVGPAMPFRRAVRILPGNAQPIGRIIGGPRAAFVFAVLRIHQLAFERVVSWRETDPVRVAEAPRHRFDGVLRVGDLRAQDRSRAHAPAGSVLERPYHRAWTRHPVIGVTARHVAIAHSAPGVLRQGYLLACDFVLVTATAVVMPCNTGVRRRALRPVEPAVLDEELLRGMVTRRQAADHGRDGVRCQIDPHYARGVVAASRGTACALIGIGREQRAALEIVLEREADRRTVGLEAAATRGGLADRTADPLAIVIEYEDVGRERIGRSEPGRIAGIANAVIAFPR